MKGARPDRDSNTRERQAATYQDGRSSPPPSRRLKPAEEADWSPCVRRPSAARGKPEAPRDYIYFRAPVPPETFLPGMGFTPGH